MQGVPGADGGTTPHNTRHATGGDDPLTPAGIGAAAASHTHAAGDVTSATFAIARIPTGTSSTTVSLGNHTHAESLVPFAPVSFTDGATITLDASLGTFFRGSLGGDRTLAVPTNGTDGQRLLVEALASSAQRTLTTNASILLASSITSPIIIPSGKRWFGGLLLSSGTWYLIASAVQG